MIISVPPSRPTQQRQPANSIRSPAQSKQAGNNAAGDSQLVADLRAEVRPFDYFAVWFLSHKINFVTMFLSISLKKNFFSLRNQEILCFLCVLDPGDHFMKSRPASCGQHFNWEKFRFKIISFGNHLIDPLHTWYDGKTT